MGEQLGCCGKRIVWSRRGRLLSMWHCQCSPWPSGCLVYVRHQPVERRLAHGSRVRAPGRRRMCTAVSFGRSDRRLSPSPPWPSTFQQQFMPAPWTLGSSLSLAHRAHCVAAGLCAQGLPVIATPGSLTRPCTITIVLSHVFTFDFVPNPK